MIGKKIFKIEIDKLKIFIQDELSWRHLSDKRKSLVSKSKKLFIEEIHKFKRQYKESFLPSKNTSKKQHDSQKVEQFYEFVLFYLDEINTGNDTTSKITFISKDIKYSELATPLFLKELVREIDPEEIFSELTRIFVTRAYNARINKETKKYYRISVNASIEDKLKSYRLFNVSKLLQEYVLFYLINILFVKLSEQNKLITEQSHTVEDRVNNINVFIDHLEVEKSRQDSSSTNVKNLCFFHLRHIALTFLWRYQVTGAEILIRNSFIKNGCLQQYSL